MRIGHGYDIHRLKKAKILYLGGLELRGAYGLVGHSDADVLLHAICDALLGAAGIGDIGEHFPDTDARYKNIGSKILLSKTHGMIKKKRYKIMNIDCIIYSEAIKINPLKLKIRKKVSGILKINENKINIKAKTKEGLDAVGKKKAIAATAVALLKEV